MILYINPTFPWVPILMSAMVHFGGEPVRRVDTQAWAVPRSLTLQHLSVLTGLSGLVHDFAGAIHLVYGNEYHYGAETTVNIVTGGYYELHLQMQDLSSFVMAVARQLHDRDREPAEDSQSDETMERADGHDEHERGGDDNSLLQVSMVSGVLWTTGASFTEEFIDQVWPLTANGESMIDIATGIDTGDLRLRWQQITGAFGIPRPVDFASFMILRPPESEGPRTPFRIAIARFDDPFDVPIAIEQHWPDLVPVNWRIYGLHEAFRQARTGDAASRYFILLTENDFQDRNIVAGVIEIVSSSQDDEHSFMFPAFLPCSLTWAHLWTWLRLGTLFSDQHDFEVHVNGLQHEAVNLPMALGQSFFVQVTARARHNDDLVFLSTASRRSWQCAFTLSPLSGHGLVIRVESTKGPAQRTLLSLHRQAEAIVQHWSDLTVWSLSNLHRSGIFRGPPWTIRDGAQLLHDCPDGRHVATLCTVYDSGSAVEHPLSLFRHSTMLNIQDVVGCRHRCTHPQHHCICRHNGVIVATDVILNLEDGDYLEIVVTYDTSVLLPTGSLIVDDEEMTEDETTTVTTTSGGFLTITAGLGIVSRRPAMTMLTILLSTPGVGGLMMGSQLCPGMAHDRCPLQSPLSPGFGDSFGDLPPPGNGGPRGNFDLDAMDDVVQLGDFEIVVDARKYSEAGSRNAWIASDHLGTPSFNEVEVPEAVHLTLLQLIHGPCRSLDVDSLPDLEWHESTRAFLSTCAQSGSPPKDYTFFVYTDGSAGTHYAEYEYFPWASWAYTIWWHQEDGWRLLAADSGHVSADDQCPAWTGARQLTSAEGERAAIQAATVCLLRCGISTQIKFVFDSQSAGFGASGSWHYPQAAEDAKLLRSTMQVLESVTSVLPVFEHVKAHSGDPINEMVNTLAYDAYARLKMNPVLDFDVRSALQGDRMPCEQWPLLMVTSHQDCRFPVWDTTAECLQWTLPTYAPRTHMVWNQESANCSGQTHSVELTIASFNVRSLGDDRDPYQGLAAFLRRQFGHKGVDIVCLQETRVRQSQVLMSQDFVRFLAAADNGRGGVEVWINTQTKINGHALVSGQNFLVLRHTHDTLFVQLKVAELVFHVISFRAPHTGHRKAEVEKWWKTLSDSYAKLIGTGMTIIGCDANAHFSSPYDGSVGAYGLEGNESHSAPLFAEFLQDYSLWIPSTFEGCHWGPQGTWKHPVYGTWHCNDYVAVSHCLQATRCRSWVDGTLDAGGSGIDHLAVLLQCTIQIWQEHSNKTRQPRINTLALRNAEPAELAKALEKLPVYPWEMSVHEQAADFTKHLRVALAEIFPCVRKPPFREYITQQAWDIRAERCKVRRKLYARHIRERTSDIGLAFRALRGDADFITLHREGRRWELHCVMADMSDRLQLRRLNYALKGQLKKDRDVFCNQVAQDADNVRPSDVMRKLRAIGVMGKARRRGPRVLTTMLDEQGEDVVSVNELNSLWRRHFEEMEDGYTITPDRLLHECHTAQMARAAPEVIFNEIPSLCDFERALRLNKWGKSAIFDGIPTDVCHLFPQLIAQATYPLFVKQALCVTEPITYKGGVLIHAYKGRGSASVCSNYRALMVSSVLAKANHRILRADAMKSFEEFAMPLQIGGLPGRAVGQGAQSLIAFSSSCRQQTLSSAILFVDVRQAFYRMLRSHVVSIQHLDESVARLFSTLRLPDSAFAEFAKELHSVPAVAEAGISPYLQAHLTESISHTWFRLPQDAHISRTRKGSRPGDNLADLLFSFSFRRILASVVEELTANDIDLTFESCGAVHPFPHQVQCISEDIIFPTLGPVWADDLAVFIWSRSASDLLPKTRFVATTLLDAMALRGMDVNLEKGKTEIVPHFLGKGAHMVKRNIYRHADPVVELDTRYMGKVFVRLVSTYKHLGTVFAVAGRMSAEIRQRLGHAKRELRRFRKQVYSNSALAPERRVTIFCSLVLTGLLFDIAVWPRLQKQELQHFEQGIVGLYRSLALAIWGEDALSWRSERITAKLQLSDATTLLRVARLRHLQHLCLRGDQYIWAFLHLEETWLRMVHEDLEWMQQQIPRRVPQVPPEDDWVPGRQDMDLGRRWKYNIKMAQRHHDFQNTKNSDWQEWHRQILYVFRDEGLWDDRLITTRTEMNACMRCQRCFKSDQAWSVHAFKIHGRPTPARRFAAGNTCTSCLRCFAYHSRLVNHLKHSKTCREDLKSKGLSNPLQPSVGSSAETKQKVTRRDIPVLRSAGPFVEQQEVREGGNDWDPHELEFAEDVLDYIDVIKAGPEFPPLEESVQSMWQIFQRSVVRARDPRFLLVRTIAEHNRTLDMEDGDEARLHEYLEELLEAVARVWNGKWLLGHLHGDSSAQLSGSGLLTPTEEIEKLLQIPQTRVRPPRVLPSKSLTFLHLFSGYRRVGDLQEAVERLADDLSITVKALSVDVVISLRYGDLLRTETLSIFVAAIKAGWVSGVVAGPPCETWSKAREKALEDQRGPRPVRSVESPQGLSQLSVRELKQVLVGNRLLGVAVYFMALCWVAGVYGVLEHPALPKSLTSPSIWRLPVLQLLMRQQQILKTTIYQGFYGAKSPKPTDLLLVHPPADYQEILMRHRICDQLPEQTSIGLNKDGSFQTAELKTYPKAMCDALAAMWGSHLCNCQPCANEKPLPDDFSEVVQALHSQIGESTLGPDFCPLGAFTAV